MSQFPPFVSDANPHSEHLNGSPAGASDADQRPRPTAPRDAKGRFSKGNPGGPGNPFARQVAKLRSALVNKVTEADMERIAEDLITKARLGNMAAIKLLFQYVLGKPGPTVNPDTLDIEEWQKTIQPLPQMMQQLPKALMTLPADVMNGAVRIVQPSVVDQFAHMLNPLPVPNAPEPKPNAQKKTEGPEHSADHPAIEPAAPSANGGNGRKKTATGPSTNGGGGQTKLLTPWLAEITAKLSPPPTRPRKGHRQGRKKR